MNYVDSTDSFPTHTDLALLTNSTNMPTSPHAHANTVRSVQSSTNSHTTTPTLPPYDICRVLSSNHTRSVPSTDTTSIPSNISTRVYESSDGVRHLRLNAHIRYSVSNAHTRLYKEDSLVDRGANGGFAGDDVRVMDHTFNTANVTGIEDHTVRGLPIGTVAGLVQTHKGKAILIMH